MSSAAQLERDAGIENSEGHAESFAAQYFKVRGDPRMARNRLSEAALHYDRAARAFEEAAQQLSGTLDGPVAPGGYARAKADFGRAASDYWYAGRAYADAREFEQAAREMAAAAAAYMAEARLREQDGEREEATTLRVELSFRYIDAQRYWLQAAGQRRDQAVELEATGKERAAADERARAAELEAHARDAAANAEAEAPRYHAGYEHAYR